MRGDAELQADIMLAVTPDDFVPADHPVGRIKPIVDAALVRLSPLLGSMYSRRGQPSSPPEHPLKASLLIALYSVRSEGQFCERLRYDLLAKSFIDLNIADEPFDASTFSKNREQSLAVDAARAFCRGGGRGRRRRLLSAEHFTADGTLLEAWASLKSYRPRDGEDPPAGGGRDAEVDSRGSGGTQRPTSAAPTPKRGSTRRFGADREAELPGPRAHRGPPRLGGRRGADRGERPSRARGGAADGRARN